MSQKVFTVTIEGVIADDTEEARQKVIWIFQNSTVRTELTKDDVRARYSHSIGEPRVLPADMAAVKKAITVSESVGGHP